MAALQKRICRTRLTAATIRLNTSSTNSAGLQARGIHRDIKLVGRINKRRTPVARTATKEPQMPRHFGILRITLRGRQPFTCYGIGT